MSTTGSENACILHGQYDFYGLGIRLGFYMQWFATVLAFGYFPRGYGTILTMSFFISIAVGIAFLRYHIELVAAESLILVAVLLIPFQLCQLDLVEFLMFRFAGPKISCWAFGVKEYSYRPINQLADLARLIGSLFLLGTCLWGLVWGIEVMKPDPPTTESCPAAAVFGVTYLDGAGRAFLQAYCVLLTAGCVLERGMFMYCKHVANKTAYSDIVGIYDRTILGANPFKNSTGSSRRVIFDLMADYCSARPDSTPLRSPYYKLWWGSYRMLGLLPFGFLVCFYITGIELVIYQNGVREVTSANSSGQLIPLTIGVGSFMAMIVDLLQYHHGEKPHKRVDDLTEEQEAAAEAGADMVVYAYKKGLSTGQSVLAATAAAAAAAAVAAGALPAPATKAAARIAKEKYEGNPPVRLLPSPRKDPITAAKRADTKVGKDRQHPEIAAARQAVKATIS